DIVAQTIKSLRVAIEAPTIGFAADPADIISRVADAPWQRALNIGDGIDLPTFEQLGKTLLLRQSIAGGQRHTVSNVVVAVAIIRSHIEQVRRQTGPIPISTGVI